MPESSQKFYLTTPIYYVNARPHIGHAYTTIVADVLARRHRLLGHDTFFLTGTDEHGQKIERSAAAAGIPPQQFADQISASFRQLWDRMGITYDDYIRTTEPRHEQAVQKLFRDLQDRGHIYLSTYTGQYCVSDEAYVDGPPGVRCPDCGRLTETVSESNYYFRLSAFQRPLLDLIESNQLLITPDTRRNEVLSFLRSGLKDFSISRTSFHWGVPVPGHEEHVIYVWFDALINYMSAIGYGSDAPEDVAKFRRYWPADLHLVGKEIIRFHCVYWPAVLFAAGLPTPKAITAHGWLLFEDSKMSKSKGNIVRTETILDAFGQLCPPVTTAAPLKGTASAVATSAPLKGTASAVATSAPLKGTASAVSQTSLRREAALAAEVRPPSKQEQDLFGTDVLRYFLLREIPFGQDGSFSFDALVTRYNADLANGYGNLVSRVLTMIQRYFDGTIPTPSSLPPLPLPSFRPEDFMRVGANGLLKGTERLLERCNFSLYLEVCSSQVRDTDEPLSRSAPWKELETEDETLQHRRRILYTAAESIRIITALLYPILPFSTAKVWAQLGLGSIEEAAQNGDLKNLEWGGLKPGTKLGPLGPIFPRADKGLAQIMADIEQNSAPQNLSEITTQADANTSEKTEFVEGGLASATDAAPEPPPPSRLTTEISSAASPAPLDPTHPAAGPRTSGLEERNPITQVGGSASPTTQLSKPPSHTEAQASGPFASTQSSQPITQNSSVNQPASPATNQITIDDFARVELRVAKILVCERIPKADKLLRLEVDLGYERRQILSGIAEWYTPEDLLGRKIVVITNLAPRKMRGLESHGMLLAASTGENGKPALATFADSDNIEVGARLK